MSKNKITRRQKDVSRLLRERKKIYADKLKAQQRKQGRKGTFRSG